MKKPPVLTLLFSLGWAILSAQSGSSFTPLPFEAADMKADSILRQMTLEEKLDYIGGDHFFFTQKIKRLGIPAVPFVDATQGIRLNPSIINPGFKKPVKRTIAYPAPILLAATWSRELACQYAHSIGEECRAAGLPLLLGPGLNLYRNSQCGRNFEYFGEDPFLAGELVANYVTGLQSTGTIATLKHFIANQTDYYRRRSNSVVDERTLHEIYMPAFKRGIDAGAMAVMTSYNLVNGEWAGQSEYVISHLLREELGLRWLVMTDWFSVWDGEKVITSGQDLEMPYRRATKHADRLLEEGAVSETDIDRMVRSTLRTFIAVDAFNQEKDPLGPDDYRRLETVALSTAREGMVLLRNERNLLPVDTTQVRHILLTGEYADRWVSGKGAGYVKGYDNITLKVALKKAFGDRVKYVKRPSAAQLASADLVILNVGTEDREASDRPFDLPTDQEAMIEFCSTHNPNTIVLVTSGSGINMSGWENIPAILYTWYMGQNGATAAAEILSGLTNPSGKLPVTIERSFTQSPAFGYIPEGETLYEGFRMRKELRQPVYDVNYAEGVFVGYRWYESQDIEPLFCFGHGLSYTSFAYSELNVSPKSFSGDQSVEVSLTLTNTGEVDGAETVQLYVRDTECSVPRPEKELKEFTKVYLPAGESKTVTLQLEPRDFMFWHPEKKTWVAEPGAFRILVGASSRDIRSSVNIILK